MAGKCTYCNHSSATLVYTSQIETRAHRRCTTASCFVLAGARLCLPCHRSRLDGKTRRLQAPPPPFGPTANSTEAQDPSGSIRRTPHLPPFIFRFFRPR